jgi:NAD(P)-dependent dehydrogenase (short-subunit alcohol dehydrogenase family)
VCSTRAKQAVEGLTKTAARAHAAEGARLNSVASGFIDTELPRTRTTPSSGSPSVASTRCAGWGRPRWWPSSL